MQLQRVALSNFRNYAELDVEPASGLNVFVGANAQGKSNLLEAIAMLGTGKSFRTSKDADLVRDGLELGVVAGDARVRAGVVHLGCSIARGARSSRKTYTINGQGVRYARFLGSIRVVTFVPADLHLVAGPPSLRRGLINIALAQEDRQYFHELARYQKVLQQKSAMLRGLVGFDPELLAIYDNTLVEAGTYVMLARNHFVSELAREARATHAQWTHEAEDLDVRYAPNVAFEAPTGDAVSLALTKRLREVGDQERIRKTTLAGPHRDDIALDLNGSSLASYGSQGQQRTAVLALKVAEYAVMRDRSNEAPLLLLDDVLSELDEERAAAFLAWRGRLRASLRDRNPSAGGPSGGGRGLSDRARGGERVLKLGAALGNWTPGEGQSSRTMDPLDSDRGRLDRDCGPGRCPELAPRTDSGRCATGDDPLERVEPAIELSHGANRDRYSRASAGVRDRTVAVSRRQTAGSRHPSRSKPGCREERSRTDSATGS